MIVGFGIDAVDISRIRRWMEYEGLLARFSSARIDGDQKQRLGCRIFFGSPLCCKRSVWKRLGSGLKGITLKNILVTNNPNGKPELMLFDDAAIPFERIHGTHIHLSLTHESNMAIAGVILKVNRMR